VEHFNEINVHFASFEAFAAVMFQVLGIITEKISTWNLEAFILLDCVCFCETFHLLQAHLVLCLKFVRPFIY